jgi:lipid-binding SYLF domain-containing protein
MRNSIRTRLVLGLALLVTPLAAWAATSQADAQEEVVAAGQTLDDFVADPDMKWFRDHSREAKGLLICSKVVKAGFIIGGSGGRCVFVAKQGTTWNGPAFYTVGTASAGFQAGVESSAIIGLVKTQKAVDALMSKEFKLGGDASVAVGPVGAGTAGFPGADIVYYSRAKGLYGGLNLSGARVKPSEDYNNAYYGKTVYPTDIIIHGAAHIPAATPALLTKVEKLYAGK